MFSLDPHTNLFLKNSQLTGGTNLFSAEYFVKATKAQSIWSQLTACYLFLGGSATSHKYNIVNTSAYTLSFFGGITHSASGIKLNGTNGYCDTGLNNSGMSQNNIHLSVYSTTTGNTGFDISGSVAPRTELILAHAPSAGACFFDINNTTQNSSTFAPGAEAKTGLYISNRTASNVIKLFRRGSVRQTDTDGSSASQSVNFLIGRFTGGGNYSFRNYTFASIGESFTDAQASTLNDIVQQVQIFQNRQAY
jgi:hypothetical protein